MGSLAVHATPDQVAALSKRFDDLERRYRLLLADYVQRFGSVPSLTQTAAGDENQNALNQS